VKKIKVLLADDHAVLRAGLKTLFEAQADIEVVAEAANGDETVSKSLETAPDIILLDITMPGLSSADATRKIKERNPEIKILVLTMHEDENYLHQMLHAGADSYVPKKAADSELLSAIRATYRGEHFIHSSMTANIVEDMRSKAPLRQTDTREDDGLSKREREVLGLVAQGYTNQQIADRLFLSVKTIETYKSRIMEKLNLRNRVELVRFALQRGLLS